MGRKSIESAGGAVVAQDSDGRRYLALVQKHDGQWVLPKGHRDREETLEQTALREVEEETGIPQHELRIVRYLGGFDFDESVHGSGIGKQNHFFLMTLRLIDRPALTTDLDHAVASWHPMPITGLRMAYPYQEELVTALGDAPLEASGGEEVQR